MNENIPDHVYQSVYGRMGFSPERTQVITHRPPYVLLLFLARETEPYSIVNLRSRLTMERFDTLDAAETALAQYAAGTYRHLPPEEI